ncbi:MAG: InlB B-repeat-containing protein, partial [Treponema sp.]|nr:InlB B-repeat-containing protein [Treponema sp.]
MKTIKKLFILAISAALIGVMISCPNPTDSGGSGNNGNNGAGPKTTIVFDNTRGQCVVAVYSYSQRTDTYKITEVSAGSSSAPIEWNPSPDGYSFYLSYLIPVGDDIIIPYNPPPPSGAITVRIDEGKTTTVTIGGLDSSPALLTDQVYLLLYNESDNAAFRLEKQGTVIRPEKIFSGSEGGPGGASLVNPHERAWYTISAAPAAGYYISVNGVHKPFPPEITEFQAGRFYTVRYVGNNLIIESARPLSLEALLGRRAPTGLAIETRYSGSAPFLQLVWQQSFDAVSYTVYRKADGEGSFSKQAEVSVCSFGDTGVSEGQTYTYKVGAVFNDGKELASETISVSIRQSYVITISGTPHGVITSKTSRASEGNLVVLTISPDIGYQLKAGSLKYHDGSDHPVDDESFSFTMPACNVTVSAEFEIAGNTVHMVTFDADGGSPAMQTQTANSGDSVGVSNMPTEPAKSGYAFGGWYTKTNGGGNPFTATTPVSGDITVYAKWIPVMPENLSLNDTLAWISNNAVEGGSYTITVKNNETIAPRELSYGGKTVNVILKGDATEQTVSPTTNGVFFTIGNGTTLTLDNNITLQGRNNNTASLIQVNSGGTLVMNTGSKINENKNTSSS